MEVDLRVVEAALNVGAAFASYGSAGLDLGVGVLTVAVVVTDQLTLVVEEYVIPNVLRGSLAVVGQADDDLVGQLADLKRQILVDRDFIAAQVGGDDLIFIGVKVLIAGEILADGGALRNSVNVVAGGADDLAVLEEVDVDIEVAVLAAVVGDQQINVLAVVVEEGDALYLDTVADLAVLGSLNLDVASHGSTARVRRAGNRSGSACNGLRNRACLVVIRRAGNRSGSVAVFDDLTAASGQSGRRHQDRAYECDCFFHHITSLYYFLIPK